MRQILARHGITMIRDSGDRFTLRCGGVVLFTATPTGIAAWMRLTGLDGGATIDPATVSTIEA